MPKYKKKRHNRIFNAPKRSAKPKKQKSSYEDIKMSSYKALDKNDDKGMRLVSGKKRERGRKFKAFISICAVFVALFLIFEAILPAGVIQTISNYTSLLGTGSYPISLSGTKTYNTVTMGNYYYHLSDTHFSAFSNAGKKLFSEPHGFEKPVLTVSKGKSLIYDQGGKELQIFDLKGLENVITTENEIISAAISDSGNFSIVTYSDEYASAVSVYNKKNKIFYEWFSAEDTVNAVAMSGNGKKIAVATYKSASGIFSSKVNIINCTSKSATPLHTKNYENTVVYGLKSTDNGRFCVVKADGVDSIKWSDFKTNEYKSDYTVSKFRVNTSSNVAVFCRESDNTDNTIVIFSKKGKVKYTVKYKGIINDIQVKGSNIYCINDSQILILDFNGKITRTMDYGYGGVFLNVNSTNTVAIITDNEIKRIKLDKKD